MKIRCSVINYGVTFIFVKEKLVIYNYSSYLSVESNKSITEVKMYVFNKF